LRLAIHIPAQRERFLGTLNMDVSAAVDRLVGDIVKFVFYLVDEGAGGSLAIVSHLDLD